MHQATIDGKSYEVISNEDDLLINGEPLQWDVVRITEGYFHILYNDKSYRQNL